MLTRPADSPRRPVCSACLRPLSNCLCHLVHTVTVGTEVLILQHPLERGHAKNSARLLHLCLPGSRLVVGERFDAAALQLLLYGGGRSPVLLYPAAPDTPALSRAPAAPAQLRLVLLDATWRKSRKMLHLHPALAALPRLALDAGGGSRYLIRKAHAAHQLSSFEAAVAALAVCERAPSCVAPLLQVFDAFVMQQAARVPHLNTP